MNNKFILLSRSLWSAILPLLLLVLNAFGVTGSAEIGEFANGVVEAVIVIASLVLQFLHQRNPKPTNLAS
jgi:amino acid permease